MALLLCLVCIAGAAGPISENFTLILCLACLSRWGRLYSDTNLTLQLCLVCLADGGATSLSEK
jgi:hypothetical protein